MHNAWMDCIALRPRPVYIRVHDLEGKPLLRYDSMVESGYNPNLSIIVLSQIYSIG